MVAGKKGHDLAKAKSGKQDSTDAVATDGPTEDVVAKDRSPKDAQLADGHIEDGPLSDGPDADGHVSEDSRSILLQHLQSLCCLLLQFTQTTRLCVCRQFTFNQLPDHLMLRIFRDTEAVSKGVTEQDGPGGQWYHDVSDDTLTVLTDGYQRRCGLPLVCKRWDKLLSQPSFVWAYLNLGFHELWDVQQAS